MKDDCVGLGNIVDQCYICSNDTSSEGTLVAPEDHSRFLFWQDYFEALEGNTLNLSRYLS